MVCICTISVASPDQDRGEKVVKVVCFIKTLDLFFSMEFWSYFVRIKSRHFGDDEASMQAKPIKPILMEIANLRDARLPFFPCQHK